MKRGALLAIALFGLVATASCRQIAGIQDLPKPCADPLMIDDMEDGDLSICATTGRRGAWYSFGDGTNGTQSPPAIASTKGARGASRQAIHFSGSGYTGWGTILGINLDVDGAERNAYSATGMAGVTFWMKSSSPVEVQFPTRATAVIAEGGTCADGDPNCNQHFQFAITAPLAGWTQVRVPFTALRQTASATWNPADLLGIQFHVTRGDSFDVWIDDLAFTYCAATECAPTCTDPDLSLSCPKGGHHAAGCFPPSATCAIVDGWCASPALIDDMEDGDPLACTSSGRQGHWYTFSDDSAALYQLRQDAIPGGREGSQRASHLTGSGLVGWGAGMGLRVNAPGASSYDASAAGGIHFWMKGIGYVRVQLRLPDTTPVAAQAGTCTDGPNCDNPFFFGIVSTSDDWVEYRVPFAALRQSTGGTVPWDPSRLLAIEFSIVQQDFDFWVDDVSFYDCTGAACLPACADPWLPIACPATSTYPASCWPEATDCAHPTDLVYSTAIWGSGADDVWIAGFSGVTPKAKMTHWDGVSWTPVEPNGARVWGLWGSGRNDLWATGERGTIRRWSGAGWTTTSSGIKGDLFQGVWGSGPSDVWAGGAGGALLHWNGTGWSASPAVTSAALWGIWGSGPGDVWAVGGAGTILHLGGSGWSVVASQTTGQLDGVWGSGPNDVWAVGQAGTILHWNGVAWASSASGTTSYLDGVWGSGANDVWAAGEAGTIVRWDGSAWRIQPSGTTNYLATVWGSGPNDVYLAGDLSTVLHWDGQSLAPIHIYGAP